MIAMRSAGIAALSLLLLTACVSTPKPEAIGATELGAAYGQLRRPGGGRLLATCGSDPLATEARSALSSWVAVMRHTDVCDLPTIRYYTTAESTAAATGALSLLASRPGACGAEARQATSRVDDLASRLRAFSADGAVICGVGFVEEDARESVDAALNRKTRVEQMIRVSFPEVGG